MSDRRHKDCHCKKLFVVPFGHSPPRGLPHTGNIRVCRKAQITLRRQAPCAPGCLWSGGRGARRVRSLPKASISLYRRGTNCGFGLAPLSLALSRSKESAVKEGRLFDRLTI